MNMENKSESMKTNDTYMHINIDETRIEFRDPNLKVIEPSSASGLVLLAI